MDNLRVAWLVPVAWYYWQPMLSEFTRQIPQTTIFTALFPGYSPGYENSFHLKIVGKFKVLRNRKKIAKSQYGSGYTALSPKVILPLLRYKPDLVFTSSFGLWTLLALLFKPIGRWQVIIAYEGSSPGVDFLNSPIRLEIRKLMVKVADFYISNSQGGKNYLINSLKANPEKVFAHPYEVPSSKSLIQHQSTVEIKEKDNKPVFLFVGRIIPRKGLQLLLEACILLKQQGFNNYSLWIVGDGEQRSQLEAFCEQNQLQDNIRWQGKVDYHEINSYFQAADVFILPTLEDTWGVVTLEVMLFGKAVLCSAGAGSSELIVNGKNGYIFEPDRPQELATLMQKFIVEPELARTVGEQSRQIIEAYTPEKAAEFLVTTIKSIQK